MLTEEQIKIRAFGEEFNKKARETETAQDLIDLAYNQRNEDSNDR